MTVHFDCTGTILVLIAELQLWMFAEYEYGCLENIRKYYKILVYYRQCEVCVASMFQDNTATLSGISVNDPMLQCDCLSGLSDIYIILLFFVMIASRTTCLPVMGNSVH